MNNSNLHAMRVVVESSLFELNSALADAENHPTAALSRGLREAETLSSATARFSKLVDGVDDTNSGADRSPVVATVDIKAVSDVLDRLRRTVTQTACSECGGIIRPDDR